MEWISADDEWLPNGSKNRDGARESQKSAVPDISNKKIITKKKKKKLPPEIKEIPLTFE